MNYFIASILGIILGQVSYHLIRVLPPILEDENAYKRLLSALCQKMKLDYKCSVILVIIFNMLIYFLIVNVLTYIYMFVIFALLVVFVIDFKYQLIPDTIQIIIALLGIIYTGIDYPNFLSHILGAVLGGGAFFLIGIIGKAIYKKEGMGFGDVKLMAGLGLVFGFNKILVITILSFFIAAIVSIFLVIFRAKKIDSYIPFGPFIVISTVLVIFMGTAVFTNMYMSFCSMLGTWITDLMFKIIY